MEVCLKIKKEVNTEEMSADEATSNKYWDLTFLREEALINAGIGKSYRTTYPIRMGSSFMYEPLVKMKME